MAGSAPAPYGQACINCARTKCRCILRGKELSCERCHRLDKQCIPAPYTRKRSSKRRTRAAELEEKIEDLVTLLKSQTGEKSASPQSALAGVEPAACASGLGHPTPSSSAAPTPEGPYPSVDLSPEEEAASLDLFRTMYLSYFPFVHIPDDTTARCLKRSRPVLWLVVVGLTCRSTARRVATMGRVEEILARRVVAGHERGVDLLLGIVAVLGWLSYQGRGKPYMWLFIHMAMGIAGDLGLDRPAAARGVRVISMAGRAQSQPVKVQTLEETRALLGCYIICSAVGGFFQRPNPMPWSPTLHRCLERLRTAGEAPRDQLLIAQAQMQRLVDEMALSPWRNPDVAGKMGPDVSPVFYIRSMSARLEDIMMGVNDPEIAHCLPLRRAQQTTQLAIYELILHTPHSTPYDTSHLPDLHAALSSVRTWFDTFFSTPPAHHAATPFALYGGFLLACQTLHRLTLLEAEGWDRGAVRGVADLLGILDRTADVLGEVPRAVGMDGGMGEEGVGNGNEEGEDLFSRAAKLLRGQRAACAAVLEAEGGIGEGAGEEVEVPMDFGMMGFEEGFWTADMFGGAWMEL